jgi:hypothetical protein
LTIVAEGVSTAQPDMATLSLGVVTEGASADAAMRANAARMDGLVRVLRGSGVEERDIQTSGLSITPRYVYQADAAPRIQGYEATNQVAVRVRALSTLGRTLDAAISAGGNTLNGLSFGLQAPEAAEDAARRSAMAAALARARLYAQSAGLRVHRIVTISEGGGPGPNPQPMMARAMAMAEAAPTAIAPGETSLSVAVTVVFELR